MCTFEVGIDINITVPEWSNPRRPARPDICLNCKGVNSGLSTPNRTVLHGILIPRARVDVENITARHPDLKMVFTEKQTKDVLWDNQH